MGLHHHHDTLHISAQAKKTQHSDNNNHETHDIDNIVHKDPP